MGSSKPTMSALLLLTSIGATFASNAKRNVPPKNGSGIIMLDEKFGDFKGKYTQLSQNLFRKEETTKCIQWRPTGNFVILDTSLQTGNYVTAWRYTSDVLGD